MDRIVILFPKMEEGKKIRDVLIRNGYDVATVCTTGAQALNEMNVLDGGILISAYRLSDMFYTEIVECLPSNFDILLLLPKRAVQSYKEEGIMTLTMPLSVFELVNTLHMMLSKRYKMKKQREKPKKRSEKEQKIINDAKALLMERNHMTEEEAHRYIQKCSMDNGSSLVENARMVIRLFGG